MNKNILVKNFPETPRRGLLDLDVMDFLTPEEFYIHTFLINQNEDYEPTMRKLVEKMNISLGKISALTKSLSGKGFLTIEKNDEGTNYVWHVYNKPVNFDKHRDYLVKSEETLKRDRSKEDLELELEIADLERKLITATGDDFTKIIDRIVELEQMKGKKK